MTSRFCTCCGTPINEGTRFCSSCGKPVEQNVHSSTAAETSTAAHPPDVQATSTIDDAPSFVLQNRQRRQRRSKIIIMATAIVAAVVACGLLLNAYITDHRERNEISRMSSYSSGNLSIKMPDGFTNNGSDSFNFTSPDSEIVFMFRSSDIAASGTTDAQYINTDTTLDYLKSRDGIKCWDCSIKSTYVFGHYTYEDDDYNYYEKTFPDGNGSTVIMAYPSHPEHGTTAAYEHIIELALKTFRVDDSNGCLYGCSKKYWDSTDRHDDGIASYEGSGGSVVGQRADDSALRVPQSTDESDTDENTAHGDNDDTPYNEYLHREDASAEYLFHAERFDDEDMLVSMELPTTFEWPWQSHDSAVDGTMTVAVHTASASYGADFLESKGGDKCSVFDNDITKDALTVECEVYASGWVDGQYVENIVHDRRNIQHLICTDEESVYADFRFQNDEATNEQYEDIIRRAVQSMTIVNE